jgi:hypothetical protein
LDIQGNPAKLAPQTVASISVRSYEVTPDSGCDFTEPLFYVLDGGKALTAAVKKSVAPPINMSADVRISRKTHASLDRSILLKLKHLI